MAYDFSKFKKAVSSSEEWLKKEFSSIRSGQANPAILDGVRVESYGTPVPLSQVGSIMTEGPRTIRITPWDLAHTKEIEKAITLSDLGISISADEKGLRINFPELTTDRRKDIVKIAKERLEDAKKRIRMSRDEVMKDLQMKEKDGSLGKDDVFRHKGEAQKIVDECNKKMDELYTKKEKEILIQ